MSKSFAQDIQNLSLELEQIRSRAHPDGLRNENPQRYRQLNFWIESTQFCISELEIWEKHGNEAKCNNALKRAYKCLDNLHKLLG